MRKNELEALLERAVAEALGVALPDARRHRPLIILPHRPVHLPARQRHQAAEHA